MGNKQGKNQPAFRKSAATSDASINVEIGAKLKSIPLLAKYSEVRPPCTTQ